MVRNSISFIGEFEPNFNLKIIILNYTNDFSWKNGPNILKKTNSKSPYIYDKF